MLEPEGKSFGFEKPKTKVIKISFRLDKEHDDMLRELCKSFNITESKSQTERMVQFIEVVSSLSRAFLDSANVKKDLEKKIAQLEKEKIQTLPKKPVVQGEPYQESLIVQDQPLFQDDAVKDERQVTAYNQAKFRHLVNTQVDFGQGKTLIQATLPDVELPKCLRRLSTMNMENWLVACEVCQGQAPSIFEKCQTTMKKTYVRSQHLSTDIGDQHLSADVGHN